MSEKPSEHSVEELKRQWESARGRLLDAATAEHAAKARYEAAMVAATGLFGHVVEGPRWSGSAPQRIIVRRLDWYGDRFLGPVVKKNGREGTRQSEVLISLATDLGPYEAGE